MVETRVMIVEDDRIIASHLKSTLKGLGYDVPCSVSSGEEAVTSAEKHNPDLVLMDIELEGKMDGIEAAGQIRARFNIPVVFLSAFSDKLILERAKITEPFGYIIKPFEDRELFSNIEIALYKHKIEKELKESNEFLRILIDFLPYPIYVINTDDYTVELANLAAKTGKLSKKMTCHSLTHKNENPCNSSEHPCPLEEVKKTKKPMVTEHIHYIGENPRIFEVHGFPIFDKKGNVEKMIEYSLDITDRKMAEEKLKCISTSALDAIIMMDNEGSISFWNEAAEKIFGYSAQEANGKDFHLFLGSQRFHDDYKKDFTQFIKTGKGHVIGKTLESIAVKKDGTEFPIELSVSAVKLKDKWNAVGILRDITERKEMEEKLIRSERLAVLGQLAGGVGHELRNPLGTIKNSIYFLNMVLEKTEPEIKETLELLEKEVAASVKIIDSLLGFARPKPPSIQKVEINDVIEEALSRNHVPERVEVVKQLDETLPTIQADPDQLVQVFNNIIHNASQAMPEGGKLAIKSRASNRKQVSISFTDSGVGMSKNTLKKLFEPLFTTKAKGIGLGLAITKILVKAQGGTIEVTSEVGKGSTFTIRLPIQQKALH